MRRKFQALKEQLELGAKKPRKENIVSMDFLAFVRRYNLTQQVL